ncbi:hypothetical protein LTR84_002424 [Exophiala bonariae]|uniref:NACHT domain-containing protein n=1 Tax=Exophiala bonariae TaxID=1690606 RepID=A0AAV9NDF3_9EURO|nr:hypothetical protein LTR84_002424 [Exophiala bonariae]
MDTRRDNIERAAEGTCAWLTEHVEFQKWFTENCGLLWVTGKPGAGKSVLMDKLVTTVSKRTDDTVIVASFFVHGRGTQMQRSPIGLYRSILHQILAQSEILRTQLTELYLLKLETQGECGKSWNWHEKELYDFLDSRVKEFTSKTITIFIDGLDEFGEEMARKLSKELWSLTKPGRGVFSAIRLCIACRHYPVMDFFGSPQICVENQNSEDISKFVQATLATVFTETNAQTHIETEILHKAAGNFLWTSLILPQIARKGLSGYGLETLRKEIQNSSPELRQIYKEAVDKIPNSDKIYALHLFQWVCLAEEPLSPVQMRYVLSFDASAPAKDLVAWAASENYVGTDEQLLKLIKALSGGLVEITGGADMQTATIQCIHQSVKDYFLQQGLQDLEQSMGQEQSKLGSEFSLARAHELMFKCCMHYILTKEIIQLAAYEAREKKAAYPLLQYAVTRWPSHLKKGDLDGTLEKSLLKYFQWPSTIRLHKWLQLCSLDARACGLQEGAHMLHVAGYYGYSHLIDALVAHRTYKNSNPDDRECRTPLIYAAANGHVDAAKSLIRQGANVNSIDNQRLTPLWWAATGAHLELMEVLIEHKADLDIQDIWGRTVLLCVAANLNEDAVDTLLFNGADPSLQDDMGRSPLYRTLYNLFGEDPKEAAAASSIVEKLLEHGAQPSKKMSEDDTMLRFAIQQDLHTILDLTLQLDQFVNDIGRRTLAFLHALYIWNLPVAIKIMKTGISEQKFIDTTGYTLINYTLLINCQTITEALIEEKACDPNGRGLLGITPLIATTQLGLIEMMRSLIQIGALVDKADSDGRTPLSYAAELGQINAARLLLEYRANLNIKDNTGKTPLMWAAEYKSPLMVDLLLSHGADSRQLDNLKRSALFWAAKGGSDSVIRSLIQTGLNPEHRCVLGKTALSWAIMHHQLDAAKILIDTGGVLDAVDATGQSPLLWAVAADYFAEVELLLEQGANVEIKDNKHQTALLIAANKGHTNVMRILRKYGADPDVRDTEGFTPLLIAIRNGLTDAIESLCSASQLDAKDPTGRTALLYAVMTGNEAVAKCLLNNGAAADDKSYQGRSALSFASQYGYEGLVKLLVDHGVNINGQDNSGRTALWWAAAYGRDEVLKLLLEKGADVTIPSNSGDSPLTKAVSGGNTNTASFLLRHGSTVNLSDVELSSSLFGLATDNGDAKMVTMLIDESLNCSSVVLPTGRTLLAWAVRYGFLEVVMALAKHGIDLEAPCDDQGLTAIDMAFERGHKNIINYLLGL